MIFCNGLICILSFSLCQTPPSSSSSSLFCSLCRCHKVVSIHTTILHVFVSGFLLLLTDADTCIICLQRCQIKALWTTFPKKKREDLSTFLEQTCIAMTFKFKKNPFSLSLTLAAKVALYITREQKFKLNLSPAVGQRLPRRELESSQAFITL